MSGSLPGLRALAEKHPKYAERIALLTFHDDSVADFSELDPELAKLEKNVWKGKPLPFPILLDASGETLATYGIDSFPTTILIDPEGKLVGEVHEAELAELFAREAR